MFDEFCSWMWRQRIRLTLSGHYSNEDPVDLHDMLRPSPEHRFRDLAEDAEMKSEHAQQEQPEEPSKVLPYLALNDVFIGEALSAR